MAIPTRNFDIILVQFAKNWPSDDSGWKTSPLLIPRGQGEKLVGTQIGKVTIEEQGGYAKPAGYPGNQVLSNLRGKILGPGRVVRLLKANPAGSITQVVNGTPTQFIAIWWGTVVGKSRPIHGGDTDNSTLTPPAKTTWVCEEVKGQLARTRVCYSFFGSTRIDRALPVNEGLGANPTVGGNRSAATSTIDGFSVYTFDRSPTCVAWHHRDYLDYVLAAYGRPQAAGMYGPIGSLRWQIDWSGTPWLGAATTRLPYLDPGDVDVLSLIDRIAGENRGLTWYYSVTGDLATIKFVSMAPTAINYGAGVGLTANVGIDLDLTNNQFAENVNYVRDNTGYDYITVQGSRPLRHVTFGFPTDLKPDDNWTVSDPAEDPANPNIGNGAWRTFRIKPDWDPGLGAGGSTDPFVRSRISSSTPDGVPDGVRGYGLTPPIDQLDLTTGLGVPAYFGTTTIRSGGELGPTVIACTTPNDGTKGEDFSAKMAVSITNCPPIITLGITPSDSGAIKSWYDTRGSNPNAFYVTVGVYEWHPLQVAWMRDVSQWPNGSPRILCYRMPGVVEISRSNGVRMSVNTSGVINGNAAGSTSFQDMTPTLQLTLALLRARYEVEGGTVTWTEKFLIDHTTTLGTMIATVYTPESLEIVNAIISGITWDFDAGSTTYTTVRPEFLPKE